MQIRRQAPRRRQSGVVLVTALILLVIMTLFGLTGIRMVTQEERMAGYAYDRGLSFQAAEAALRQVESYIETMKPQPTGSTCVDQVSGLNTLHICPPPTSTQMRWTDSTFTDCTNATVVGTGTTAVTPQYVAEYLGSSFPCGFDPTSIPTCKRYRITARAGGSGRAAAMVQSVYATD